MTEEIKCVPIEDGNFIDKETKISIGVVIIIIMGCLFIWNTTQSIKQDVARIEMQMQYGTADRWTGSHMDRYNSQIIHYIDSPRTNREPDVRSIQKEIPIFRDGK